MGSRDATPASTPEMESSPLSFSVPTSLQEYMGRCGLWWFVYCVARAKTNLFSSVVFYITVIVYAAEAVVLVCWVPPVEYNTCITSYYRQYY